jgi:hypothetical protein
MVVHTTLKPAALSTRLQMPNCNIFIGIQQIEEKGQYRSRARNSRLSGDYYMKGIT